MIDVGTAAEKFGLDLNLIPAALDLHRSSVVVDGSGVIYRRGQNTPIRWDRYREGGMTAVNHTVCAPEAGLEQALTEINQCRRWIDENQDRVTLVRTVEDIHDAKRADKGAVIFGPQDAAFLGESLDFVGTAYDLGVRILQLTYQRRNTLGDGCGMPDPAGLTEFGKQVVREMDDLGMVVDLSHCSHPTAADAIDAARGPVLFTHTGAEAVTPHFRTKPDWLLRAMADKGGVVGVADLSAFITTRPGVRATLNDLVRHIQYLVELVGIDHVGLGLDIDETTTIEEVFAANEAWPEMHSLHVFGPGGDRAEGISEAVEGPSITLALLSAGFAQDDIRKILGGNFLRVLGEVWSRGQSPQA